MGIITGKDLLILSEIICKYLKFIYWFMAFTGTKYLSQTG